MLKRYRLDYYERKLAEYEAAHEELSRIFSNLEETSAYYINKLVDYKATIAQLKFRIAKLKG